MTITLTLAPFEGSHLEAAHALSQAVGWPHRADDWAMLLQVGSGFVALDGERVIGTALAARFGSDVSATFMIIVDAAYQGRGIGRKLMEKALPKDGICRLVATAEGLPLYKKLGFEPTGKIAQLQGNLNDLSHLKPRECSKIRLATPEDINSLVALENCDFGGDRTTLINWLCAHSTIFVAQNAEGKTDGFAARRDFGRGQVIGPVVAPSADSAKDLILAAAQDQGGQFIRIDTDEAAGLVPWIEVLGLTQVGGGDAMQRGDGPIPKTRFALFSQAIG